MNRVYDKQCTFGNSYYGFGEYIDRLRHYFGTKSLKFK
jgi:hypothetical protein